MIRPLDRLVSVAVFGGSLLMFVAGCAATVGAQGDLEKTPWATTMVYPVGNPLDFQQPGPGDRAGFNIARGVNLGRRGDRHEGLDLGNHLQGSEVRAVAPGLVVCTRRGWGSGWGNMVVLAHRLPGGDILFSLFAHLLPGSIRVQEGQIVALGQPLGKVGRTGHATGPHLHLEFRSMAGPFDLLRVPLAQAWERASIVDPLRIFASMRARDDSFGLPPALANAVGVITAPALAMPADPLLLTVQAGGLPASALDRPDQALTRGELYRMAYASLRPSGTAIPARWSSLRAEMTRHARDLPIGVRDAFGMNRLPRREIDAQAPASLSEMRDVAAALARARAGGMRLERSKTSAPGRADLEAGFPQGLAALEGGFTFAAAPLPRGFVGPPAVSRRQAALLVAYVAAGGTSAPGLSSAEAR